ncbi:putative molecular co-chaperone sti1 [Diplonema papillatum]|nr:putative molecular co-chaperone sti1 [Diplonema papillatum]
MKRIGLLEVHSNPYIIFSDADDIWDTRRVSFTKKVVGSYAEQCSHVFPCVQPVDAGVPGLDVNATASTVERGVLARSLCELSWKNDLESQIGTSDYCLVQGMQFEYWAVAVPVPVYFQFFSRLDGCDKILKSPVCDLGFSNYLASCPIVTNCAYKPWMYFYSRMYGNGNSFHGDAQESLECGGMDRCLLLSCASDVDMLYFGYRAALFQVIGEFVSQYTNDTVTPQFECMRSLTTLGELFSKEGMHHLLNTDNILKTIFDTFNLLDKAIRRGQHRERLMFLVSISVGSSVGSVP